MMEAMEDCTVVSAPKVEVQPVVAVLCPTAEDCIEPEEQPVNIDAEDLEDIDRWIINLVKEIQPEAEITKGSVKVEANPSSSVSQMFVAELK